jgi:hypothetical protein
VSDLDSLSKASAAVERACRSFEEVIEAVEFFMRSLEELRRHPQVDLLSVIRHPNGSSILVIGRRGERAFDRAASALMEFDPELRSRVSTRELVPVLKELFSRNVLDRWKGIDEKSAEHLLRATGRYVRLRLLKTNTHILPCILGPKEGAQSFAVGSVVFRLTSEFLDEHRSVLDEYAERYRSGIVRDLREFYGSYPWVGIVEVGRCSPVIAEERARLGIETALNAFRLGLGDHARYLRVGGMFRLENLAVSMRILGSTGQPSITWSRRPDASPWEREWISILKDQLGDILALVGSLIEPIRSGDTIPELHQRAIDALAWYGEAIAERQPHTKIVRCMLAMERLLVTPGAGKSQHKATERGARLCSAGEPHRIPYWVGEFERLYKVRNDVFHGALSPFDDQVRAGAALAERIAGRCLTSGLHWYAHLSRQNWRMSGGQLSGQYATALGSWLAQIRPKDASRIPDEDALSE